MKNPTNTISLDLNVQEGGRCRVTLSLDHLTPGEREWLMALHRAAVEGREMNFGVETLSNGEVVLNFHLKEMAK